MDKEKEIQEIKERAKVLYSYTISDYGDDDDEDAEVRLDYDKYEGYVRGATEQLEMDEKRFESDKSLWKTYSDWFHGKYFPLDYAEDFLEEHLPLLHVDQKQLPLLVMDQTDIKNFINRFKEEMRKKVAEEVEKDELYHKTRIKEEYPDE